MNNSQLIGYSFDDLELGQTATLSKTLTKEAIALFAAVSGDLNPVHLDDEYARSTPFGECIGHGVWSASIVSSALGMHLPGPGSIFRSQQMRYKEAVRIGDTITVTLEVVEKKARIRLVELACTVTNQHGKVVAQGSVEVIAPAQTVTVARPQCPEFKRVD